MLQLTDGHETVQGMEFEPIPHLSVNTAPGTKVGPEHDSWQRSGVKEETNGKLY